MFRLFNANTQKPISDLFIFDKRTAESVKRAFSTTKRNLSVVKSTFIIYDEDGIKNGEGLEESFIMDLKETWKAFDEWTENFKESALSMAASEYKEVTRIIGFAEQLEFKDGSKNLTTIAERKITATPYRKLTIEERK